MPCYTSLGTEGVRALQRRRGCCLHQLPRPQVTLLANRGHATSLPVSPPAVGHINQEVTNPKSSCHCVEHRCRCHPRDHLDGIRRESAASGEGVHQLGTTANTTAWEYQTSSLRVPLLPTDLPSPGFQPPPPQLRPDGGCARKDKGSPWLFPLLAVQTPGPCSCRQRPPPHPLHLLTAPGPAPPGLTGGQHDGKGPFFIVTADTKKKKR